MCSPKSLSQNDLSNELRSLSRYLGWWTIVKRNRTIVHYHRPTDVADFLKAQQCAQNGLELVEMATTLTPDNLAAWTYKLHLLIEQINLAEMDRNFSEKAHFTKQMEEARRRTEELNAKDQKQRP